MLREVFLQQNGFDAVDASSSLEKDYGLWKTILRFDDLAQEALESGIPAKDLVGLPVTTELARSRFEKDFDKAISAVNKQLEGTFEDLRKGSKTVEVEA